MPPLPAKGYRLQALLSWWLHPPRRPHFTRPPCCDASHFDASHCDASCRGTYRPPWAERPKPGRRCRKMPAANQGVQPRHGCWMIYRSLPSTFCKMHIQMNLLCREYPHSACGEDSYVRESACSKERASRKAGVEEHGAGLLPRARGLGGGGRWTADCTIETPLPAGCGATNGLWSHPRIT